MRLLFIIDPPHRLNPRKDSTVALMRAAARRGDEIHCAEMHHLYCSAAGVGVAAEQVAIREDADWIAPQMRADWPGTAYDRVFMRKEPPVDEAFIMATRLLDRLHRQVPVVNHPRALREQNEKLAILDFPDLIPPTWVGADLAQGEAFRREHGQVVIKPLNGMGGQGVYVSSGEDLNFRSVFNMLSADGTRLIMAQAYLPAAREGDFRVFTAGDSPLPWMLARLPRDDDHRGNLAAGGVAQVRPLDSHAAAARIARQVAPLIAQRGVSFAGLDIIGDRLIEINITCPTGLREVRDQSGEDPAETLLQQICGG